MENASVLVSEDKIISPYLVKKIAAKYRATHKEFPNHAHWMVGEPGWEIIAEDILEWLNQIYPARITDGN